MNSQLTVMQYDKLKFMSYWLQKYIISIINLEQRKKYLFKLNINF